jgi:hypothetical protein
VKNLIYTSNEVQAILQRHLDAAKIERLFAMVACSAVGFIGGWLAFGLCKLAGWL